MNTYSAVWTEDTDLKGLKGFKLLGITFPLRTKIYLSKF